MPYLSSIPFFNATLNGVAQIMLQQNRLTGILFLVGLYYGSAKYAVGAAVGSFVGAFTAKVLKYDAQKTEAGLYGFSAALVGVALFFLFQTSVLLLVFVVLGSIAAAILQNYFIVRKFPAYTFPFVFVSWVLFVLLKYTHLASLNTIAEVFTLMPLYVGFTRTHATLWCTQSLLL